MSKSARSLARSVIIHKIGAGKIAATLGADTAFEPNISIVAANCVKRDD